MNKYANLFQGTDAVSKYLRKLDNRIEVLRHQIELDIIRDNARGELFDCTIGTGRLIPSLSNVARYKGMDQSEEFVDYVNKTHDAPIARVADLTQGIAEKSDCYDTVMCLRSLSAIKHEREIIQEMIRIAKPGGRIIFDYGTHPVTVIMRGETVTLDDAPIADLITEFPVQLEQEWPVDAILTRLKRRPRLFRLINGKYKGLFPDKLLLALEKALIPLLAERRIYCLIKQ
jgi:ubiquinone/menaquinone biosynthesis C-methylase UbiE